MILSLCKVCSSILSSQNNSISCDLPYMQQQMCSDQLLLEKVNMACENKTKKLNKHRQIIHQRPAGVHVSQSSYESAEKIKKDSNKDTFQNGHLSQKCCIRTCLEEGARRVKSVCDIFLGFVPFQV